MRRTLEQSLEEIRINAESRHYLNHPDHGRVMLDQLWRQFAEFLDRRISDPLLLAYAIRDERKGWTAILNDVYAWSDSVLDADGPDVPSTGVR